MTRFFTPRAIEALVAVAVFAAASVWGAAYWRMSLQAGHEPAFYQEYFEPAVMVACGKGFVISHPQPKALEDFLWRRENTFSCDQIANNKTLSTKFLYQGAWRYMMYAVGWSWKWTGVSWSRLDGLSGILFGLTIVAAYGIFRLAMGRWLSAAGAFLLSISSLHLVNLPHLRDYSKAPFTLISILILGCLVTLAPRRKTVVLLSLAYGVVLGIGYGFRTDLLINIPPIFIVLALFVEGGVRKNLLTKALGLSAFAAAFLVTAWPILSAVSERGGGQWHVVLLGLQSPFDDTLRVQPAPYNFGYFYDDSYINDTVRAYAARTRPELSNVLVGTHDYDIATGAYYRELAVAFPADMMTRALASALQITQLPFDSLGPPMENLATSMYRLRRRILSAAKGSGPLLVAVAILATAVFSVRLAMFLLFFVLYFGGYPALQFGYRHYFHLEFMTWFAIGLLVRGVFRRPAVPPSFRQPLAVAGAFIAVIAVLAAVRLYQERQVRTLFGDYIGARKTAVALSARDASGFVPINGPSARADVRLLEVDLNAWECGSDASVTVTYDKKTPDRDYTWKMPIAADEAHTVTRVFTPVYAPTFRGVNAPARARCLAGISWVDPDHRPLLLSATLGPRWESERLYQRLRPLSDIWKALR